MAVKISPEPEIPLIRINSTTSSTYPPSYTTKYTERSSIATFETASETASTITPFLPTTEFKSTSSLQIQALGKSPISFPTPGKQLEIPIFSPETGRPVYMSIKPSRGKGTCRLVSAEDESGTSIARTTYRFGPGKTPQIRIGADDDLEADVFDIESKGLTTRSVGFGSRRWGKFEWRYGRRPERAVVSGVVNNLLVLEKVLIGDGGEEERVRVAQLVRGEETRTPGTKARYAGNGGRLEMCRGVEGVELIDEITVVVTCLVMLKREIDRLRMVQMMIISGAAGAS